jgi:hypothetical protein
MSISKQSKANQFKNINAKTQRRKGAQRKLFAGLRRCNRIAALPAVWYAENEITMVITWQSAIRE